MSKRDMGGPVISRDELHDLVYRHGLRPAEEKGPENELAERYCRLDRLERKRRAKRMEES